MNAYLKLIKLDNLILIAFAQWCVKYGLFTPFGIDITLSGFGISLLIMATIFLVAGSNIMVEIQRKSHEGSETLIPNIISDTLAHRLFIICNIIAVAIGFYVSYIISIPKLAALFIVVSGVLYIYETYLKEIIVLKNLLIALLAALSIIAVGIFDLLPAITPENQSSQKTIFLIIVDYAVFGFVLVLIREIIKDCIELDRDHNQGLQTIPITLGKDRTAKLVSVLTLLPIGMVVYYIYTYLFNNTTGVIIVLCLLVAPLLFFMIKSWSAESKKDFTRLSLFLKIILFLSSISLLLYQFILLQ